MAKIKLSTPVLEFDYELSDGTTCPFKYKRASTKQLEKAFEVKDDDIKGQLQYTKELLKECISGEKAEELLDEVNVFELKDMLDYELGKQKKRK